MPSPERMDYAVAFESPRGKPPQFAVRIVASIQSVYAIEDLET